jgi:hypothetical protein
MNEFFKYKRLYFEKECGIKTLERETVSFRKRDIFGLRSSFFVIWDFSGVVLKLAFCWIAPHSSMTCPKQGFVFVRILYNFLLF